MIGLMALLEAQTTSWILGLGDKGASVIIPTFTSLLVFALGWIITVFYNSISKRRGIKLYRKAVLEWSAMVINATRKQIRSLNKLSKTLATTKSILPEAFGFSRSSSDKLKDLSVEKVFSVFIENCKFEGEDKRGECSYNLISQYDFLSSVENIVKNKYEEYNHASNALRENWNKLILSLQHELAVVKPEDRKEYVIGDHLRSMVEESMKSISKNDLIVDVYNNMVSPLNAAVEYYKKSFPGVRCYHAVYDGIRKLSLIYDQWYALTRGYSKVFSNISLTIKKSVSILKDSIDYFEKNTKVACWVK